MTVEMFIERVPSDKILNRSIERWKRMRDNGWDVAALLAPDTRTVVALGCLREALGPDTEGDPDG